MNEAEWLACADPRRMLDYLLRRNDAGTIAGEKMGFRISDRKMRLFACACCLGAGTPPSTVDEYEAGGMDPGAGEGPVSDREWAEKWTGRGRNRPTLAVRAALLRDVVGNPFRPVTLPVCRRCDGDGKRHGSDRPFEWTPEVGYPGDCLLCGGLGRDAPYRTPTVLSLAHAAYDLRAADGALDPARLAVLADCLEEAGADEEVLRHLRGEGRCACAAGDHPGHTWTGLMPALWEPCRHCCGSGWLATGPRYRGFWALDLILGRG